LCNFMPILTRTLSCIRDEYLSLKVCGFSKGSEPSRAELSEPMQFVIQAEQSMVGVGSPSATDPDASWIGCSEVAVEHLRLRTAADLAHLCHWAPGALVPFDGAQAPAAPSAPHPP